LTIRKELLLENLVTESDLLWSIDTIELTNFTRTDSFLEDGSEVLLPGIVIFTDWEVADEDLFSFLDRSSSSNDRDVSVE